MDEQNENIIMSKFAFERMQAKDERNDRLRNVELLCALVIILVLIILLVVTNAMWLRAWNSYDYAEEYIAAEQDGGGVNIVGAGDVSYGTESDDTQENENTQ